MIVGIHSTSSRPAHSCVTLIAAGMKREEQGHCGEGPTLRDGITDLSPSCLMTEEDGELATVDGAVTAAWISASALSNALFAASQSKQNRVSTQNSQHSRQSK